MLDRIELMGILNTVRLSVGHERAGRKKSTGIYSFIFAETGITNEKQGYDALNDDTQMNICRDCKPGSVEGCRARPILFR